jgi:hypothetical protein
LYDCPNRPIAKIFFIFFLESTFKNKLKSKISEILGSLVDFKFNPEITTKAFYGGQNFQEQKKRSFLRGLCQISNFDLKSIIGSKNLKFWI